MEVRVLADIGWQGSLPADSLEEAKDGRSDGLQSEKVQVAFSQTKALGANAVGIGPPRGRAMGPRRPSATPLQKVQPGTPLLSSSRLTNTALGGVSTNGTSMQRSPPCRDPLPLTQDLGVISASFSL